MSAMSQMHAVLTEARAAGLIPEQPMKALGGDARQSLHEAKSELGNAIQMLRRTDAAALTEQPDRLRAITRLVADAQARITLVLTRDLDA